MALLVAAGLLAGMAAFLAIAAGASARPRDVGTVPAELTPDTTEPAVTVPETGPGAVPAPESPPTSVAPEPSVVQVGSLTARMDVATGAVPLPEPVAVVASSVDLDAPVVAVGVNEDGSVQIPPDVDVAGWYRYAGSPGGDDPTVLVGHVSAAGQGEGAFALLGELAVGDEIVVAMSDGTVHRFAVDARRSYDKNTLPVATLFGAGTGLRLVTCGGDFDPVTGSYTSNVVVYAHAI